MKLRSLFDQQTRKGRFFRTLFTSFAHLGSGAVYSFLLIPLVLHYEGVEKLGLWLLIAQMGVYLNLVDAGLTSLSIRRFVGPASERNLAKLAPGFQATFIVSVTQGVIVVMLGLCAPLFANLFKISQGLESLFGQLFFAQCLLVAFAFPLRPLSSLLLAAQRFEANYVAGSISFFVALGITWLGLELGWGLWAVLAGSLFQIITSGAVSLWGLARLGKLSELLEPSAGVLSLIPGILKDSLAFSNGPIFSTLGGLMQSTIISRIFGLEGVALWNVGGKIATFFSQVLSKFYESSFAGLSELLEKGLGSQMRIRFLTIFLATTAISLLLAACLILGNGPFINWWTGGALAWPTQATWGVALWLVTATATRGVAEQAKVLLLWKQIRWGPLLDFAALSAFLSAVFFNPTMPTYALALAAAPLGGSFVWNVHSLWLHMKSRTGSSG